MFDLPRAPRFDWKRTHVTTNPFVLVQRLYNQEVDGLLRMLSDTSLSESIRNAIRKYLTVTIFAAIDYFFRNSVRVLVDKHDLNTDALFSSKSRSKLAEIIKENNLTKGMVVASTFRFVDIYEIDFVFSNLLQKDSFLDYLIKLNEVSQTRFALDGHPLPIEYHKLIQAYKIRNEIAHEVTNVKLSKSRVIAMWDNLGNIMDLSKSVFYSLSHPEHLESLDNEFQAGKRKATKNATYKLCSDQIMSTIIEYNKTGRICQLSDFTEIIKSISCDKILMKDVNVEKIVLRMIKEGLIVKDRYAVALAMNGEKRFKRTSNNDRDMWKREISPIVCSWLVRQAPS